VTELNVDNGQLSEYHQLLRSSEGPLFEASACKQFARHAQGIPSAGIPTSSGSNTLRFIPITDLTKDLKATYPCVVVADRSQKRQKRHVRLTIGGDMISTVFVPRTVCISQASFCALGTLQSNSTGWHATPHLQLSGHATLPVY
jgi:hypothetical protein